MILVDTKRIKFLESFRVELSKACNNRIATFGILPADVSIFIVFNEDNNVLKEYLSIVELAFKGSVMTENFVG